MIQLPKLQLGTAMWGWTMDKQTCFEILDHFYQQGFRKIDAATNYPINKKPEDFRKSEQWLHEWLTSHQVKDLQITIKVGSLSNMRSPDNNLSKSFLLMNLADYQAKFDTNLNCFMIHWDNRADATGIRESLEVMEEAGKEKVVAGLSGIKHPKIHASIADELQLNFEIQLKHNLLKSDLERYKVFHEKAQFYCYGINAGGMKLDRTYYTKESSLKARGGNIEEKPVILDDLIKIQEDFNSDSSEYQLSQFNQMAMVFAAYNSLIKGILIGPSKLSQLQATLEFYQQLKEIDFNKVYSQLKAIAL
ncbi:MAG: aldo/keto reductase [Bacteroidota bacterium]